jgi:hypothetical protein
MTIGVHKNQPVESQNGLDLPLIIRVAQEHALLGQLPKSNTYKANLYVFYISRHDLGDN